MLFVYDFTFKMTQKCSAAVLCSDPPCKKAVACLVEKIYVSDEPCGGIVIALLATSSMLMDQQCIK